MTIPWLRLSTRVAHFLGVALPEGTDFHLGVEAWGRGDYDTAVQEFLSLAEQGHAQAQVNLGIMSSQGRGVPKDSVQAYVWSYGQKTHTGKAKAKLALLTLWERQLVIRHAQAHAVDGLTRLSRPQLIWRGYLLKRKWDSSWTR